MCDARRLMLGIFSMLFIFPFFVIFGTLEYIGSAGKLGANTIYDMIERAVLGDSEENLCKEP